MRFNQAYVRLVQTWCTFFVLLAVLASSGCGSDGTRQAVQAGQIAPGFELPPFPVEPALKQAMAPTPQVINGAATEARSNGAQDSGDAIIISADPGQMEWAMYRYDTAGNPLIDLQLDFSVTFGSSVWVCLADFSEGVWKIEGPYTGPPGAFDLGDPKWVSPIDSFYFAVIAYDNTTVNHAQAIVTIDQITPDVFIIDGTVSEGDGAPIGSVLMTLTPGGANIETNAFGQYSFLDLDPGAYTVTPSKATFTFAPESQGVNIVDADVFNVDFVGVVEVESVTYTDDMRPAVFVPVCMQCHDSNKFGGERQGAPPGVNFDTFAAAAASANRGNIRSQAGTMPPGGPLTDDQKALFQQWMDDGILE